MTGNDNNFDFDLPTVESSSSPIKLHKGPGDSTCTSCEG